MMLFLRHLATVLGGLMVHAVRMRRLGLLLLVVLGGTVVVVTVVAKVVAPVVIYPFL